MINRIIQRNRIFIALAIGLFCFCSNAHSATYFSRASGNWNSNTTWSLTSGGTAVGSGVFPVAGDIVNIERNFTVTATANAQCASINFNITSSTTTTRLTINSGISVTVSGAITLNSNPNGNVTYNIGGSGTLNAGSVNLGGSSVNPGSIRTITLVSTITSFNVSGDFEFVGWRGNNDSRLTNPTLTLTSGTLTVDGQLFTTHERPVNVSTLTLGNSSPGLVLTNAAPFVEPAQGTFTRTLNGTGATVRYTGTNQTILGTSYTNLVTGGTGTKTLDAATTLSGALTVGAGTILDLSSFNLGSPTSVTLSCGATAGTSVIGTGTLTLAGNITVNSAGTGNSGATISCPVALGASRNFTVADDGTTALDLTINGVISGSTFGVTKLGAGTMELSAANTYTGSTTVTAGILRASTNDVIASTNGAFGNNASSLLLNGGTVQSNVTTFSRPITVQATNSTLDAYGSSRTISSSITLNTLGTFDLNIGAATATNAEGQDLTLSGVISNTLGTLRLIKTGSSSATLSNTNTYTGSTTISGGTLNITSDANLGTAPLIATAGHLALSGGGIISTTGTFTLSSNRGISLGTSGGVISPASGTLSYGGIIAGSNSLTKTGAGALTLSGTNTFTGGFTLSAGTVNINNSQALGTVAGTFTISGGTINNTTAGSVTTLNYPIAFNGDFIFTGTQALNLGTGAITMNASRQITVNGSTLTLGGTINHSTLNLTKAGTGTLSFGSQSVTLKDLSISAGTLTSTSGTLNIAGNFTNSGTFSHNSGTVNYTTTTGGQAIAGVSYRNLTLSNTSGTNTAGGSITVGLNFTMSNSGATLDMGSNDLSIGGGISMSGTIKTQSTSATPLPSGLSWGGTIDYNNASGSQTIMAGTYTNLKSNNTSGTNTAAGVVTVNGQLTMNGGTFDMSNFALGGTLTTSGTGTIKTQYSSSDPLPAGVTWLPTIEYNRSGAQTVVAGSYSTLVTSGSGTKTMSGNVAVSSALTLTAGTLEASTNTITIQTSSVTKTTGVLKVSSGTVVFDFNSTLNLPNSFFSGGINNMTLLSGAVVNLPATPNVQALAGTLNLSSGKLGLGTSATLALGGTVSNMSATNCIVGNATGSIQIAGSGAMGTLFFDQTTPGTTNTINNFVVGRTDLTGTLTIGNTLRIKTLLTPTAGTVTSNGNLVIGSDASGTAKIYPAINSSNFAFVGDVKVERYAKDKVQRRFMLISSPVDGISVRNAWQDDVFITGAGTGGTPCGAGTGNGGASDKYNSNGFDATILNTVSLYRYDDKNGGWIAVPNTSYTLQKGRGYRLLYRGPRGTNDANCSNYLTTQSPPAPTSATLNVSGTLITQDFTVSVDGPTGNATAGYTLLGNPFAGDLAFDQFASDNNAVIAAKYWIYDPNNANTTTGATSYLTYNNGIMAGAYSSDPAGDPSNYPNPTAIASGQAFFVEAGSDGTVSFSGTQLSVLNQTSTLFKTQSINRNLRIHFRKDDGTPIDNIVVRFSSDPAVTIAENKNWDALSFNSGSYLTAMKGTRSFAIQTRPLDFYNDTVQLKVVSSSTGNFKLVLTNYADFVEAAQIILIDQFTGTQTDVKNNPVYSFTITSSSASQGSGRFKLVFRSMPSVMPLSYLNITATQKTQGAEVSWKVAFEQGVSKYQVERSEDGTNFTVIGSVDSKGNSNTPVEYVYMDTKPINGIAYYRVKSIEAGGGKYSPIVKLNSGKAIPVVSIYPNPVKDRLNITVRNNPSFEKAAITIRNIQGKTIWQAANVMVNNYSIDVTGFAAGMYVLTLTNSAGELIIEKFMK